jgi:hypothetical protein
MRKTNLTTSLLSIIALLAGCASPTTVLPVQPPSVTLTSAKPVSATPSATSPLASTPGRAQGTPLTTPAPNSVAPAVEPGQAMTSEPVMRETGTPEAGVTQVGLQPPYLDDRSTPTGVMQSLFNAINRKEYLRAYSYWENAGYSPNVPPFAQFEQGYQETASVDVTIGMVGGDVGAGQIYYTVPVVLQVQTTTGEAQTFAGCYTLHLARPEIQAAPPFQPLAIQMGSVKPASNIPNTDDLLANACEGPEIRQTSPMQTPPVTNLADISAANYLDDRSDAVLVLSSLFNAINRKEYVRAYSYWQNPGATQNLPPFDKFQKGYQETVSVEATFGTPTSDAGAGQIYYNVPTALKVKTTSGQSQTFIGCYTLHLAQPAIQGTPPFEPLGIQSANIKQVPDESNITELLSSACQNAP